MSWDHFCLLYIHLIYSMLLLIHIDKAMLMTSSCAIFSYVWVCSGFSHSQQRFHSFVKYSRNTIWKHTKQHLLFCQKNRKDILQRHLITHLEGENLQFDECVKNLSIYMNTHLRLRKQLNGFYKRSISKFKSCIPIGIL